MRARPFLTFLLAALGIGAGLTPPAHGCTTFCLHNDGRLLFRTRDHRPVRTLSLAALDFRCGKPVRVLSLNADVQGDVAGRLLPYTRQLNYALLRASTRKTPFLASMPDAEVQRLAAYPEAGVCRR